MTCANTVIDTASFLTMNLLLAAVSSHVYYFTYFLTRFKLEVGKDGGVFVNFPIAGIYFQHRVYEHIPSYHLLGNIIAI